MEPGRKSAPIYRSPSPLILKDVSFLPILPTPTGKASASPSQPRRFSFLSQTLKITEHHPIISGSIAIGSSIEGDLEAVGDLDWFKVELEAEVKAEAEAEDTTESNGEVDAEFGVDAKAKIEAAVKTEVKVEAGVKAEVEARVKTEVEVEVEAEVEAEGGEGEGGGGGR